MADKSGIPASPTTSIIVPTRNRPALLGRALRSAVAQTHGQFEAIIVDDASDDAERTAAVVRALGDERFRVLRRGTCGGPAGARNTGIGAARGDIVAFLDDDDELLPSYVEKIRDAYVRSPVTTAFVWGARAYIADGDQGERLTHEMHWPHTFASRMAARRYFMRNIPGGTGGLCVRRSAFDEVGLLDESMPCAVDTELILRLGMRYDFAVVPDVVYAVHRHGSCQVSRANPNHGPACEYILRKHALALAPFPGARLRLLLVAAKAYLAMGDTASARRVFGTVWWRVPANVYNWRPALQIVAGLIASTVRRRSGQGSGR